MIQILSLVGLTQSLKRMNSSILEARNRTQTFLRYSVVVFAASVAAFAGGLHWAVVGVATGYAVSSTIVEPYYTLITVWAVEMRFRTVLASLRGVAEASVAITAAVLATRLALESAGASAGVRPFLCIAVGGLVYLPACGWRAPEIVSEIRSLRPRRGSMQTTVRSAQPSEP